MVGVVFSDSVSLESRHLAEYLGSLLYLGQYSCVRLVNISKSPSSPSTSPILVIPPAQRARVSVLASEDFVVDSELEILKGCHLILICVSSEDTSATAQWLSKHLPKTVKESTDPKCIISLQHGCRNFEVLCSSDLSKGNNILLDGSVGFHIVKGADDGVLRPILPGQLVVERLSKEKAEHGEKFVNLLSTAGIPILFSKSLTRT